MTYVENIGEHKEESDEHSHSPWDNFWGYEEAGPWHDNEESRGEVVDVQVLELVTRERDLDPSDGEVAQLAVV